MFLLSINRLEKSILGTDGRLLQKVLMLQSLFGRESFLRIKFEKLSQEIDTSIAHARIASLNKLL